MLQVYVWLQGHLKGLSRLRLVVVMHLLELQVWDIHSQRELEKSSATLKEGWYHYFEERDEYCLLLLSLEHYPFEFIVSLLHFLCHALVPWDEYCRKERRAYDVELYRWQQFHGLQRKSRQEGSPCEREQSMMGFFSSFRSYRFLCDLGSDLG